MKLLTCILPILIYSHQTLASKDVNLNPGEMIANHGYPSETHLVTTDDDYIITLYRIPHGINNNSTHQKPPVYLMHGYRGCAGKWVALGPKRGLAYILADAGYDVWLGNARGTTYSRNHTSFDLNIEPEKYWNFSWHEIGTYDLANSIDYILKENGAESLYYVGHSQGTTVFLVLASIRPEYNDKIRLASLMAPAAIVKHYPNIVIQTLCKYIDQVWYLLHKYEIYELPFIENERNLITSECANYPENYTNPICDFIYNYKYTHVEKSDLPIILSNCPSNAGMKQHIHYGQLIRDGGFRQFDYGTEENLAIYGTEKPPDYDLSKISTTIAFYYAKNDHLITIEDENTLVSMVPNVALNYLVEDDEFGHSDFSLHSNVVELVYNKLLSVMKNY